MFSSARSSTATIVLVKLKFNIQHPASTVKLNVQEQPFALALVPPIPALLEAVKWCLRLCSVSCGFFWAHMFRYGQLFQICRSDHAKVRIAAAILLEQPNRFYRRVGSYPLPLLCHPFICDLPWRQPLSFNQTPYSPIAVRPPEPLVELLMRGAEASTLATPMSNLPPACRRQTASAISTPWVGPPTLASQRLTAV